MPAPEVGATSMATIPVWLAAKHKQLVAFESTRETKDETMADRDMSGSHSKNARKEKPSHADYTGSIMIEGRKFWLNGWIRDGEKGKFLSLSARAAEEPRLKPAASRMNFDKPIDDPF